MIYQNPNSDDPIDQGDLIDGCPVAVVASYDPANPAAAEVTTTPVRVVVMTQTCDLANEKVPAANVAVVFEAQFLVDEKVLKPAEIKVPLRSGRIWGWYFLPADAGLGLGEMIVDLRRLHTVKLDLLRGLCRAGKRRGRVGPCTASTSPNTSPTPSAGSACRDPTKPSSRRGPRWPAGR